MYAGPVEGTSRRPLRARYVSYPSTFNVYNRSHKAYVDYGCKQYMVVWKGSGGAPNLATFPHIEGVEVLNTTQTDDIRRTWELSRPVAHGMFASVRETHDPEFPIIKLIQEYDDSKARSLIAYEFQILGELNELRLPVVRIAEDPLRDELGIFGFTMERLHHVKLKERADEARNLIKTLHNAGYCHGDLMPANIMADDRGRLKLIDFSFAGQRGKKVPSFIEGWVYRSEYFTEAADREDMYRLENSLR